ncbi:MAG: hypothetical protein ABEJ22_07450 [Haloferacaceae archaeon]
MSNTHDGAAGMHSFERNNYFYGKLLTVRDMATEQAYHTDVQRTLSRYVTGFGGVCGLEVTSGLETDEDGDEVLEVRVSEGLALDQCGRLVVVADEVTRTLPVPVYAEESGTDVETDTVSVYVEYEECFTEPVPVAKTESACDDECESNRVIESADVTVVPGEPAVDPKSVAEIEFPDPLELGETDDRFAERITVRGDLAAQSIYTDEPATTSLDLVFTEGVPRGTATVSLSVNTVEQEITGRLSLPTGQFVDEDGLRLPDGEFDLTGAVSLTGENDQRSTDVTGTLEIRDGGGQVTLSGVLDDDPQAEGQFDFDLTLDRTENGVSFEKTLRRDVGEVRQEARLTFDLTLDPLDGDRLASGELSLTIVRGSGDAQTAYDLFTLETTEWERADGRTVDGLLVDVPERSGPDLTAAEIDHLLARMARSYYENEPRESCPDVSTGPILVGTITRDGGTWAQTTFERGPLVYTNDMLYDVVARHATDYENPHDVKLEVGGGAAADGGAQARQADASLGVEGPAGPEGTVGFTSSDGSIDVTPNRGLQTLDFTAQVGMDEAFERYHVYERSLQTTREAFTELVEDSHRVWAPQEATHLAFRVARTAMHALERGVHESPAEFVAYLTGPHQPYYPEAQLSMGRAATVLSHRVRENVSVVDLERALLAALDPEDGVEPAVPVRNYRQAFETLDALLGDGRSPSEKAAEVARAQHRVAEAAGTVLDSHPAVVGGFEGGTARPRVGRGLVPGLSDYPQLEDAVEYLRTVAGWTYLVESQSVDAGDALDDPVNRVRSVVPKTGAAGHRAAGVRLQVVAPPAVDRIDGIGSTFRNRLARAGIDTVAELAVAGAEVAALVTGTSGETAWPWIQKARAYCDAYPLTRARGVGVLEAEALAEVETNLDYTFGGLSSLAANQLDEQRLLADLRETGDDVIASKYRTALREVDWAAVRDSI